VQVVGFDIFGHALKREGIDSLDNVPACCMSVVISVAQKI